MFVRLWPKLYKFSSWKCSWRWANLSPEKCRANFEKLNKQKNWRILLVFLHRCTKMMHGHTNIKKMSHLNRVFYCRYHSIKAPCFLAYDQYYINLAIESAPEDGRTFRPKNVGLISKSLINKKKNVESCWFFFFFYIVVILCTTVPTWSDLESIPLRSESEEESPEQWHSPLFINFLNIKIPTFTYLLMNYIDKNYVRISCLPHL